MDLVICGLAAHRLWLLWLSQLIFRPFREGLSRWHPRVAYAVNCGVCTSVWVAAGIAGAWHLNGATRALVWILAISEAVAIMESVQRLMTRASLTPPRWHPEDAAEATRNTS